jgi:signal transduction histidine kinase
MGGGLGLVGMRERVAAHDGTLTTGPRLGGGFQVTAILRY